MLLLFSACGEQVSVVTTTTAPTTTTTVETTTIAKTTTTVTTTMVTTTMVTTTAKVTTTTSKITTSPSSTTLPSPEPSLLTPSEDKQQFVAHLKGEDVLFTFSNAEAKPNGDVEWYYKGLTADGFGATCCVIAQQERIYWITCSYPNARSGAPQEEEARTFVLSELDSWGFVTDGAEVDVTSLSDKQVTGKYANVRVTLSDTQTLVAKVRKFGEKLYFCGFGVNLKELNHPLLIPNWITE